MAEILTETSPHLARPLRASAIARLRGPAAGINRNATARGNFQDEGISLVEFGQRFLGAGRRGIPALIEATIRLGRIVIGVLTGLLAAPHVQSSAEDRKRTTCYVRRRDAN
jgi:hypothetical protein